MSIVEQGATVRGYVTGTYYYDESSPSINDWKYMYAPFYPAPSNVIITNITEYGKNNKKGDDNMRYLYEVILVNPEDEEFEIFEIVAKTETSALLQAYEISDFSGTEELDRVEFDDLKTHCRVLMEWKALENIKKAIE